jgi:putative ABC transport system substrate-binding protein
MMRRAFVKLIGGVAIAWPLACYAQEPNPVPPKRIGLVTSFGCLNKNLRNNPISRRLTELGWIQEQNYIFECVSVLGRLGQLPELAHELVLRRPDVLIALENPLLLALKRETPTIPIAQQRAMPTIGFLSLAGEPENQSIIEAFRSGLADFGYTEGTNIRVLYRYADGHADRLSALTAELISLGAITIVTSSATSIQAAHNAAPNVPVVSWVGPDPVMMGWAQSLARPGGMITGLFFLGVFEKRLELLKQVRPQATTVGYLLNASNPANKFRGPVDEAARALGLKLEIVELKEVSGLADAIGRMTSLGVAGVVINPDPVFYSKAAEIAELARVHKLPSVGDDRKFVDAGGLFALSINYPAMARHSARFVDQILKGTAPGELAVERPTEFKVMVNLKTAKELGITIPPSVLARADELIE